MPGVGAILSGRGNYCAFGVTTLYVDITDYMIETIKGDEYLYEGKYYPLRKIEEVIKIKN
jgi:acyl-homoserine lactone acylase PvdQ